MRRYDVIVAGVGGMGAAAAAVLATRGVRVVGLDRFPVAHDRGSSHGHTRLIRLAYHEHADYVPLLRRAYAAWRGLEEASGARLLVETGLVLAGPPGSEVIDGALSAAAVHGLTVERPAVAEAAARWPGLRIPESWHVVLEPRGGHLRVEACVRACAAVAVAAGADLHAGAEVRSWRTVGDDVVVETDTTRYAAARLVLCPGAWAAELLRLPRIPLAVLRKSLFWYPPATAAPAAPPPGIAAAPPSSYPLPCFAFDTPAGFFYGLPPLDGRGIKVAEHTGGDAVADPATVDRALDVAGRGRVDAFVATHLPAARPPATEHAVCLYTMSPDGHFVVGPHPDAAQVVVAAGFSGHGFKFASVVGEILADLALDGRTALPIGFLAPGRFTGRPSS